MIILAHPDDESFPIGGTLAKSAAEAVRVVLVCATKGEAGIAGLAPEATAEIRERELHAAAQALGIAEVVFLGYLDGQLAQAEPEAALLRLVALMRAEQPQAIITFGPDGISGHPDHLAIYRLTTAAFDQADLPGARLYYIAPSEATQLGCGVIPTPTQAGGPVAAIDVSEYLVAKARAMQSHVSQNPPYTGLPEEAATRLACHEYFTLARPRQTVGTFIELFALSST